MPVMSGMSSPQFLRLIIDHLGDDALHVPTLIRLEEKFVVY
jgi:hypothetical protein